MTAKLEASLGNLPRAVLIEAVYIAGQRLTHQRWAATPGLSDNAALSETEETVARDVADKIVAEAKILFGKEAAGLSDNERSMLMTDLHQYLRRHVNHASKVKRQADAELERFRELSITA